MLTIYIIGFLIVFCDATWDATKDGLAFPWTILAGFVCGLLWPAVFFTRLFIKEK